MDVLTCAASTFQSEAPPSGVDAEAGGDVRGPSAEAQIAALKRKLIDMDRSLTGAHDRILGLEKVLEMEKREHQLTTSKLTVLLKKRGAACPQCEQRRLAGSGSGDSISFDGNPAWMAAEAMAARTAHFAQDNGSAELPPHAQPRVYARKAMENGQLLKRGATPDLHAAELGATQDSSSSSDSAPSAEPPTQSFGASAAMPPGPALPPTPTPSPMGGRVPFGYVPGAISVELPKRQRSHKNSAAFPRSNSSLT